MAEKGTVQNKEIFYLFLTVKKSGQSWPKLVRRKVRNGSFLTLGSLVASVYLSRCGIEREVKKSNKEYIMYNTEH